MSRNFVGVITGSFLPHSQERNKILFNLVIMAYGGGSTMSKTSMNYAEKVLQSQVGIIYRQM